VAAADPPGAGRSPGSAAAPPKAGHTPGTAARSEAGPRDPTPAFQRANLPLRVLATAENWLMFALLAGTVLVILVQVLFRYALQQPLSWSNEAATDLLVYVAFIGFAIGVRDNAHVALHLFEKRIGARARRWQRIGELLILGAVLVCIGAGGATYLYEQRDVVSPVGIPLWAAFLPLPAGALLGSIHIVVEIVALLRGADVPGLDVEPDEGAPGQAAFPGGAV
jgi:TRAP-type C4-dicarboxylate transport system permease small subunit